MKMHTDHVKRALDVIHNRDDQGALDLLKEIVGYCAAGEPPADGDEPGSEGDGAEGVAPAEKERAESPRVVGNAAGLSAREVQIAKEAGCDPKDFAALKAFRDQVAGLLA
ncbi:MAG TPA: hypothetical protein VE987_22230 [Polyangiaceae bacterium]|nr:hypothetical protein [Polyangiaceae bacterium]